MALDYRPFCIVVSKFSVVDDTAESLMPWSSKSSVAGPVERARFYSLRESARILRLDRGSTLRKAISDGLVKAVQVGAATRISGEELARILQEGLPLLPGGRRPPRNSKKRAPIRKARPSVGSIAKIPL